MHRRRARRAAIALENVAFHSTEGIVIKLDKLVIVAPDRRKQLPPSEPVTQFAPAPVKPARQIKPVLVWIARPVDAKLSVHAVGLEKSLEHRGPPRPSHDLRCGAHELLGHRHVGIALDAAIAKKPPG